LKFASVDISTITRSSDEDNAWNPDLLTMSRRASNGRKYFLFVEKRGKI
jgi:hypothetical protein